RGPSIGGCGVALFALADPRQPYWVAVFPGIVLLGIGMAMTVPPLTSTVMAAAGKVHAGIASGVNNAVARIAGLLAVAALGAVLFADFSSHLSETAAAHANEALGAVMSGQPGADVEAISAFEHARRTVMLVTAGCAALAGLFGWLVIAPDDAPAGR